MKKVATLPILRSSPGRRRAWENEHLPWDPRATGKGSLCSSKESERAGSGEAEVSG